MSAPTRAEPPTTIVLTSLGVGGAEKRFTEIFLELIRRGEDIRLVLPQSTFAQLIERSDMTILRSLADDVTCFEPRSGALIDIIKALRPILKSITRGSVVHYPLTYLPLLHRRYGHRLIVSWVATFLPAFQFNASRLRWITTIWGGFFEACLIDVLNPLVRDRLAKFPRLRRKLRLTAGGTFIEVDHFRPLPKRDRIVFLGRLEHGKNAPRFVRAIPEICRRLRAIGAEAEILLYGKPADAGEEVAELLARDEYRILPIRTGYTADPVEILADAKVFLSLQVPSNYPSKSLAEAMACGCIPIITDVGESRLMADPSFAEFIPPAFTPDHLAGAIARVFALSEHAFEQRSKAARAFAEQHFRLEVQADYFQRLYAEARRCH